MAATLNLYHHFSPSSYHTHKKRLGLKIPTSQNLSLQELLGYTAISVVIMETAVNPSCSDDVKSLGDTWVLLSDESASIIWNLNLSSCVLCLGNSVVEAPAAYPIKH